MTDDTNKTFNAFLNILKNYINTYCPFTTKKSSRFKQSQPWLTPEIKSMIKRKNKLFLNLKKNYSIDNFNKYKSFRNILNNTIKFNKKLHYEKLFQSNINNMKGTWHNIKELINKKNDLKTSPLIINNEVIHESKDIATAFNEYFTNLFNIPSQIDPTLKKYLGSPNVSSCFFEPTNSIEILHITNSLSNSNSSDFHNLSNKTIKTIMPSICHILTLLFNKSILSGTFPDCLKIAKIIPIHKSGSHTDTANYRPISLISIFSKIFEKIIKSRLTSFFDKYKIITDNQYGFRKGLSTELALLKLHNNIIYNMNKNNHNLLVFIDFSKAFDSVHHEILFLKLEHYGIRGTPLNLIKSYLTNRTQYVKIENEISTNLPVISGVPQGSVLGPLLFIIFLNDIINASSDSKLVIYADDCTLYSNSPNLDKLLHHSEQYLLNIDKWSMLNKLIINLKKTKFMITSWNRNFSTENVQLNLNGNPITRVDTFKLLGVVFDAKLNFKDHVNHILTKVNINLGVIYKIKKNLNQNAKKALYYALFYSHFYYGNLIWGNTNRTIIQNLYSTQRKIVNALFKAPNQISNTNIFNNNRILTIYEINSYKACLLIFKITHNIIKPTDNFLFNTFQIIKSYPFSIRTQNEFLIKTMLIKNKITSRNICYYGTYHWNLLPLYLKSNTNFVSFRKQLLEFLNCQS